MQIRPMTIEDYNGVHKLWSNTSGIGLNDIDDSKDGITKYLCRNPNTCFVALEDGEVVGALLCGHDGRRGTICRTAVAQSKKRQGIGKALVNAALAALKKEGIRKVWLVVMQGNIDAGEFWQKQGFALRNDISYHDIVI